MTTTSTCWTSGLLGSFKRSCRADGDNYFDDNRDDDYEIIPETGGDGVDMARCGAKWSFFLFW